jgi:hypothetical protein
MAIFGLNPFNNKKSTSKAKGKAVSKKAIKQKMQKKKDAGDCPFC